MVSLKQAEDLDQQSCGGGDMTAPAKSCKKLHGLDNPCCIKKRYTTKHEANGALLGYMSKYVFTTIVVYSCTLHQCFHLGHDKYMGASEALFRSSQAVEYVFG